MADNRDEPKGPRRKSKVKNDNYKEFGSVLKFIMENPHEYPVDKKIALQQQQQQPENEILARQQKGSDSGVGSKELASSMSCSGLGESGGQPSELGGTQFRATVAGDTSFPNASSLSAGTATYSTGIDGLTTDYCGTSQAALLGNSSLFSDPETTLDRDYDSNLNQRTEVNLADMPSHESGCSFGDGLNTSSQLIKDSSGSSAFSGDLSGIQSTALWGALESRMCEVLEAKMSEVVKSAMSEALKSEMSEAFKSEISGEVSRALRSEISESIKSELSELDIKLQQESVDQPCTKNHRSITSDNGCNNKPQGIIVANGVKPDEVREYAPPFVEYEEGMDSLLDVGSTYLSRTLELDALKERTLSTDTFSFFIYAKMYSKPSFLAGFVFTLQILTFGLVLADIIDDENEQNPLNLPPNVESPVRATEVFAIAIAIITQDDIKKAISLWNDGYEDNVFRSKLGPDASKLKWILSIVVRVAGGSLGLFATFLLIMQSETVLDLLLNFSAMEFVSLFDDVVFSLASDGYFGYSLKREALALSNLTYHVSFKRTPWKTSLLTALYFVAIFVIMFAGWGFIFAKQASGAYLCSQVYLQFDDALNPILGLLTGMYYIKSNVLINGRSIAQHQEWTAGILGYCKKDKIWTLQITENLVNIDPCYNWIARSSETTAFDITQTSSDQWYARTESGRILPMDHSYINCYDCIFQENFCGEEESYGYCGNDYSRKIDYNKCNCTEGRYGLRCEFEDPCVVLQVDPSSQHFEANREFASTYYLAPDYHPFDRPVYTSSVDLSITGNVDVISFLGRKWVITSDGLHTREHWYSSLSSGYSSASFISEEVDFDSDMDSLPLPLGLKWYAAPSNRAVDVVLLCAVCNNDTNPCLHEGLCQSNGTCLCSHETKGTLCQITPIGNGYCNEYFNTATFDFDGGDCCEDTCVSTDAFVCGKDETGFVDVGYSKCISTGMNDSWVPIGNSISGVNGVALSGASVALAGNGGTVLAVGDPGASIVRIFDKDGSKWVQRGRTLEGPQSSDFGYAISLSMDSESDNIKKNSLSSPLVTLVVGAPKAGIVQVYQCQTNGCAKLGNGISCQNNATLFGRSVSSTKDGSIVAIGASGLSEMMLYRQHKNATDSDWFPMGQPVSLAYGVSSVTLAGNGDGFALGNFISLGGGSLNLRVYKWHADEGKWIPIGRNNISPYRISPPLHSIKLSHDSSVIAYSTKRFVNVHEWNESLVDWIQRDIDFDFHANSVQSIDLSPDGSILVIGTSSDTLSSKIHVLKWNGTHYSSFQNITSESVSALSLCSDARALAVGSSSSGMNQGKTTVYKSKVYSKCNNGFDSLRLSFMTDDIPLETSWKLQIGNEEIIQSQNFSAFPFATFVEEFCVPMDSCVKFKVTDSTGLAPPGGYSLMLNSKEIARSDEVIEYGEIFIGSNCDCPVGTSRLSFLMVAKEKYLPIEWALAFQNQTWVGGDILKNMTNAVDTFDECIPDGCWYLANPQRDTEFYFFDYYDVTYNGRIESGSDVRNPIIKLGKCWEYLSCNVSNPGKIGDWECDGRQYNTEVCGWDGGDCLEFNKKYPNCDVDFVHRIGDGKCDGGQFNTEKCQWDGGDCHEFNKYPDCNVTYPHLIGDDECDAKEFNTEKCGWDGGDCLEFNQKYPDCEVSYPKNVGNGVCDGNEYNSEECGWDGGDCLEFNKIYPGCNVSKPEIMIGNGKCSGEIYNTSECGWDGGDCLERPGVGE